MNKEDISIWDTFSRFSIWNWIMIFVICPAIGKIVTGIAGWYYVYIQTPTLVKRSVDVVLAQVNRQYRRDGIDADLVYSLHWFVDTFGEAFADSFAAFGYLEHGTISLGSTVGGVVLACWYAGRCVKRYASELRNTNDNEKAKATETEPAPITTEYSNRQLDRTYIDPETEKLAGELYGEQSERQNKKNE